jgi:hypothetical protein
MIEVFPIPKDAHKDKHDRLVIQNLILNYKLAKVAEIGVFKGRTMRAVMRSSVASNVEQWFAIDPWQPNELLYPGLGGIDSWDGYHKSVCRYMPWFPQLRVMRLRSLDAVSLFMDGYFDMVYLDGDHSADAVEADIKAWVPKVKKGGIIGGHDYVEDERVTNTYNVAAGVGRMFGDDFEKAKCSVWYKVVA